MHQGGIMAKQNPNPPRRVILRRPQVEEKTGLSRSTIYLYISKGQFPAPINLGPRTVGWIEAEIDAWLESRERMTPRYPVPAQEQAA